MYTLPLAVKIPMLVAAVVCAGVAVYSPGLAYNLLKCPPEMPTSPAARLILWLVRKSSPRQSSADVSARPDNPTATAELAARSAFLGGALGGIAAAWVVELLSEGSVFQATWSWTTALRGAAGDILPLWVMGYVFWRIGHQSAHNATQAGPTAFVRGSRFGLSMALRACTFSVLAGLNFVNGIITLVDLIYYALVKAGLV